MVLRHPGFKFKDGVYFSFEDFKRNCPAVPLGKLKDRNGTVVTRVDESQGLFFTADDTLRSIDPNEIFGYSNQGKVSLVHEGNFDRLVVIGTLCHLVQREIVIDYNSGGLNEFNSMPVRREVRKEFILDMRTGEMSPMKPSSLDYHVADDSSIASLYAKQSQRQRKTTIYSTLHAYNRKYPLYFSISRCKP